MIVLRKWILTLAVAGLLGYVGAASRADENASGSQLKSIAEKKVREIWALIAERNIGALEKQMAPGFQSIHSDGTRSREQELALIKGLNLTGYKLDGFNVTEAGPVVIVTYFVTTGETIDGKQLPEKRAARMSCFLRTDDGWKWITHANLRSLK